MKLTEELKKKIDSWTYEQLLSKWRFAPIGDSLFQPDSGDYIAKRMRELRDSITPEEHTQTSKKIGWEQ